MPSYRLREKEKEMNKKLKVWKVFFEGSIDDSTPEAYIGAANVVASDIDQALEIAKTYGKVKSMHGDEYFVVTEKKKEASASPEEKTAAA